MHAERRNTRMLELEQDFGKLIRSAREHEPWALNQPKLEVMDIFYVRKLEGASIGVVQRTPGTRMPPCLLHEHLLGTHPSLLLMISAHTVHHTPGVPLMAVQRSISPRWSP
jgi:hypothetical protein